MIGLLLCAGLGTRLRHITSDIPKCLVQIGDRPLLDYWIEHLVSNNIEKIYINTHHFAVKVESFIDNHPHQDKITLIYEEELLGTGGTLRSLAGEMASDHVFMAHADNFCLAPINEFISAYHHRPEIAKMAMMTFRTPTPSSCGIVELDDNNIVQNFHEKVDYPIGNLANGAVFILDQSIVEYVKQQPQSHLDFSLDIIPKFLGRILAWENTVYHRDIGTPESYEACQIDWEKMK